MADGEDQVTAEEVRHRLVQRIAGEYLKEQVRQIEKHLLFGARYGRTFTKEDIQHVVDDLEHEGAIEAEFVVREQVNEQPAEPRRLPAAAGPRRAGRGRHRADGYRRHRGRAG